MSRRGKLFSGLEWLRGGLEMVYTAYACRLCILEPDGKAMNIRVISPDAVICCKDADGRDCLRFRFSDEQRSVLTDDTAKFLVKLVMLEKSGRADIENPDLESSETWRDLEQRLGSLTTEELPYRLDLFDAAALEASQLVRALEEGVALRTFAEMVGLAGPIQDTNENAL